MSWNSMRFLDLPTAAQHALVQGARDGEPVRGLTHSFYKYPARFSPTFARAAIETFTSPGDLCLDPHVGGGTTLVEALVAGRNAIGVDISELAEFVTKVKSTIFSEAELEKLERWSARLPSLSTYIKPRARVLSMRSSVTTSISIMCRAGGCAKRSSRA